MNEKEWGIRRKDNGEIYNWGLLMEQKHVGHIINTNPNPQNFEVVYREVGEWKVMESGA